MFFFLFKSFFPQFDKFYLIFKLKSRETRSKVVVSDVAHQELFVGIVCLEFSMRLEIQEKKNHKEKFDGQERGNFWYPAKRRKHISPNFVANLKNI